MSVRPSRSFTWQPRRRIWEYQGTGEGYPTCGGPHTLCAWFPQGSHLIANDVYLVLDLGHPLTNDGKQLRDGGLRVKQNLLARRVIGIEEGEGWGGKRSKVTPGKPSTHPS
jgi:hypothetical protein